MTLDNRPKAGVGKEEGCRLVFARLVDAGSEGKDRLEISKWNTDRTQRLPGVNSYFYCFQ